MKQIIQFIKNNLTVILLIIITLLMFRINHVVRYGLANEYGNVYLKGISNLSDDCQCSTSLEEIKEALEEISLQLRY